ncbi:hypothetical protein, partial [Glycomyces salinus]|uniref:hypothetical protein n=1 Tax=Glycomyces salinus TaxID=980294 RepID=UPI0018ED91DC
DRAELADCTTGLRQARPDLRWRRAEALIQACYGEPSRYLEVPTSEQPALMWAVLARIVPPDAGDDALTALFDRADRLGCRIVAGVFETQGLYGWADEDDPDDDEPPAVAEEPR